MSDLSFAERLAVEQIQEQTDYQLQYAANEFNFKEEFDHIDYFLVTSQRVCVTVPKMFFVNAVLMELAYRQGEGTLE